MKSSQVPANSDNGVNSYNTLNIGHDSAKPPVAARGMKMSVKVQQNTPKGVEWTQLSCYLRSG